MKYLLLILTANFGFTSFSYAHKMGLCYSGSTVERKTLAQADLLKIFDLDSFPTDNVILKKICLKPLAEESYLPDYKQSNITERLAKLATTLGCEFNEKGQFNTVGETVNSMANSFHKAEVIMVDEPLIKPGFEMKIFPTEGKNYIYAEVTEDGFVFHECVKDDADRTRTKVKCDKSSITLMGNGIAMPVEQVLHGLSERQHIAKVFLKALGQTTVVLTSSLSLGLLSPIASVVSNYVEQDSMARIKRDYSVYKIIKNMLRLAAYAKQDEEINREKFGPEVDLEPKKMLTDTIVISYADLRDTLWDVMRVMLVDDFKELKKLENNPGNPSFLNLPALKIKQSVYRYENSAEQYPSASVQP